MLVGDLMVKVGGNNPQASAINGRMKLYDWLLWCFPWLNAHHRDTLTGEPQDVHRPNP